MKMANFVSYFLKYIGNFIHYVIAFAPIYSARVCRRIMSADRLGIVQ